MAKQQQQAHANKHMNPAMFDQSMRTSSSHSKLSFYGYQFQEGILTFNF